MQKIVLLSFILFFITKISFAQTFATIDSIGKHNDSVAKAGGEVVFTKVDKEAEFPGGINGWRQYLEKNLRQMCR